MIDFFSLSIFPFSSFIDAAWHDNTQKKLLTFTIIILILSSNEHSIAHGQDLLSKRPSDYGLERNTADANGEAVATNSLSSLSPNEPSCEELRMMWR